MKGGVIKIIMFLIVLKFYTDVVEAGFTDANNDGQVDGTGVDANGLVTGGDGYGTPADVDNIR